MRIITIILLLLLLSFYFIPGTTKNVVNITGKAVYKVGKQIYNNIKDTEEVQDYKEDIINKSKDIIKDRGE